jgi:hypothetical protein
MKRALPSHGTAIAYVALFLALAGSGYAAKSVVGAITGGGPTVVTQEPAYTVDYQNNPNFLTPVGSPSPNPFLEEQVTVAEDSNPVTDARSSVYTPLQSPSKIAGGVSHLSSVQFCLNLSANTNPAYHGTSTIRLDRAAIYEFNEPNPGGVAGSGNTNGAPPYGKPVALVAKNFTGLTQIDNCPTIAATKPLAINRNGYLMLFVTIGLTTTGGNPYGTNLVQLGRVTTTYTP